MYKWKQFKKKMYKWKVFVYLSKVILLCTDVFISITKNIFYGVFI